MKTLVIAPHPDDELLGCGGTLLRRIAEGGSIGWLLMTAITEEAGWQPEKITQRTSEIQRVCQGLGVYPEHFFPLGFSTSELDSIPMSSMISRISEVFTEFEPEELLLPYPGDVHSDHRITFDAASACTKWFRYPSVRRVLVYETLSETDFGVDPRDSGFRPNIFVDISQYIDRKLELMSIYECEMGAFPFPRSEQTLRALAQLRGSRAGVEAAEGFMLIHECF